jgi:branched-chain amino acid transport system substrate-binding protein
MRRVLGLVLAAWVGLWILALSLGPVRAQGQQPIKVGALFILSGNFAGYGKSGSQGAQLAAEEINARGGVLGRPIQLVVVDDQGNPEVGVREARRLILQEKVDFLFGIDSSSVALAVAPLTDEYKIPLVVTHAATPTLTEQCRPYVFRTSNNARMDAWAGAALAATLPVKRWANIGPDYEFGRVSWQDFITRLKQLRPDVEVVSEQWPRFGSTDYASFITALMRARPEGVFSTLWAGDMVIFARQAKQFGFFNQVKYFVNPVGAALEVLAPLGKETPEGLLVSARYWFLYPNTERNRAFVEAYRKRFGEYPSYNAQEAYAGLHMLARAVEKAKSTQAEAVRRAFEADGGLVYDAPEGRKRMRPEDHQVFEGLVWGYTKHTPDYPFAILDRMRIIPASDTVYPTQCKR